MQNRVSAIPGVLTVEVDLDTVSEGQVPPAALERAAAERLGWSIAEDLQRILGGLDRYGLVVLGGLYDTTELLRPGLPIVDILMDIYRRSLPDTRFQAQVLTIGSQGDTFPIPAIAPRRQPGSGPLFLVPFVFLGETENMDELGSNMEKAMLEKGRASLKTGQLIESEFGIKALNLSYATFNDLCALMKVQLENSGFANLWTLLEAALFPGKNPVRVQLDEGNLFILHQGTAYTRHPGFDEWARRFASQDDAIAGYAHWQRLQRQYTAGLASHGLAVRTISGTAETAAMETAPLDKAMGIAQQNMLPADADRVQEVLMEGGSLEAMQSLFLLEHRLPHLGPVAYTVTAEDAQGRTVFQAHEYPLVPEAVQRIPESWREVASSHGVHLSEARPGVLSHGGQPPRLLAAPMMDDKAATH